MYLFFGHPVEMMICRVHARESDDKQNTFVKVTNHSRQLKIMNEIVKYNESDDMQNTFVKVTIHSKLLKIVNAIVKYSESDDVEYSVHYCEHRSDDSQTKTMKVEMIRTSVKVKVKICTLQELTCESESVYLQEHT